MTQKKILDQVPLCCDNDSTDLSGTAIIRVALASGHSF